MLVKVFGSAVYGICATTITVEVTVAQGIKFVLVGLPDNAVKESQQRIESALTENGYRIPGKKIVINMAPADIRKEGTAYDLTLAIGILAASGQIPDALLHNSLIMGELSLDGGILPIKGALPIAIQARNEGFKRVILPIENAREAAIVRDLEVLGAENVLQVIQYLSGDENALVKILIDEHAAFNPDQQYNEVDFSVAK